MNVCQNNSSQRCRSLLMFALSSCLNTMCPHDIVSFSLCVPPYTRPLMQNAYGHVIRTEKFYNEENVLKACIHENKDTNNHIECVLIPIMHVSTFIANARDICFRGCALMFGT